MKSYLTVKAYTDRAGITDLVASVAGAHWPSIALIPVHRTNGSSAGAYCYKRNRLTGQRFDERMHLHRNLSAADLPVTLKHELAHAIHTYECGRSDHGPTWLKYARALGCPDKGCSPILEGSLYLNAQKFASSKWQYRCVDCGHIIRKLARPRFDRPPVIRAGDPAVRLIPEPPAGDAVNAFHADCRRAGKTGQLIRLSADEIRNSIQSRG